MVCTTEGVHGYCATVPIGPQSGRATAQGLPLQDYRFRGSEVAVKHFGNGVLLLPIDDPWQTLEDGLAAFRHQPLVGLEGLPLL